MQDSGTRLQPQPPQVDADTLAHALTHMHRHTGLARVTVSLVWATCQLGEQKGS